MSLKKPVRVIVFIKDIFDIYFNNIYHTVLYMVRKMFR